MFAFTFYTKTSLKIRVYSEIFEFQVLITLNYPQLPNNYPLITTKYIPFIPLIVLHLHAKNYQKRSNGLEDIQI